ncbi:MAG TPA: type I phosphomannose isomerase catalytic subunit [Phycisphaerae bacterium]|nr:type I phosphomannose isomerase catalytic subunit [Phycisphaerae bacterium]
MNVHPLIFEPILKRRIWGGRRLEALGKRLPPGETIGESWEVADLEQDQSVVRSGLARGKTLPELVRTWGDDLLGGVELFEGRFPLLIKFLDAAQLLSVQVHPDQAMAKTLGGQVRVKDEAWYVIDAEPDGAIYYGLNDGVDRAAFAAAIDAGTVVDTLRRVPVRPGDCYYLPAGTLHALGAGVLVAEVQTPSDVTYRVYDWDRVDPKTQRPRQLHVEQALQCIHFDSRPPQQERSHVASVWTTVTRLVTCPPFVIERVRMREGFEQAVPCGGLVVWIILEGRGELSRIDDREPLAFHPGDTVVLPAALTEVRLKVLQDCMWLEVTVPQSTDLGAFEQLDLKGMSGPQDPSLVQLRPPQPRPPAT